VGASFPIFTLSGTLDLPAGILEGEIAFSFTNSGTMTGDGALSGSIPITFANSGTLDGGVAPVIRDLGAKLPTYYLHRLKRIQEVVPEPPAVAAILRALDEPAEPMLSDTVARLVTEMQAKGIEWQESYTQLLREERERAEQLERMEKEDIAAVFMMLELL